MIRKSIAWLLAGRISWSLSQIVFVVLVARIGDAAALGTYGIAIAIVTPIFALCHMNLRQLLATEQNDSTPHAVYLQLQLVAGAVASVAACGVAAVWRPEVTELILVLSVVKAAEFFAEVIYGGLQRLDRASMIARSMAWRSMSFMLIPATVYWLTADLQLALAVFAVASIVLAAIIDVPSLRDAAAGQPVLRARPDPGRMVQLVRVAFPLGLQTTATSLITFAPRYFLDAAAGVTAVGFFTALQQVAQGGQILVASIRLAILSPLSRLLTTDREGYWRLLFRSTAAVAWLCFAAVAFLALFGGPLLRLVFGPAYVTLALELVLVMAAASLRYVSSMLNASLITLRRTTILSGLEFLSLGALLGFCRVLVPDGGIQGAGVAMLAAGLVQFTIVLVVVHRLRARVS